MALGPVVAYVAFSWLGGGERLVWRTCCTAVMVAWGPSWADEQSGMVRRSRRVVKTVMDV